MARRKAIIQKLDMFLLHGEPYFEVAYSLTDEPGSFRVCRMGNDGLPPHTQAGDIVWAEFLMDTVLAFKKEP